MSQELLKPEDARNKILEFEDILKHHPDAQLGDQERCPLTHRFGGGMYVREIFIPKGMVVVGKIHRHEHPNFLMRGEVLVYTEHGGREHLKAPMAMISSKGTKRVVLALEDTVWVTVHLNPLETTDLSVLEHQVIAPDYKQVDFVNTFPGVYEIKDHKGRRYIGSAVNIAARWSMHRFQLKNKCHGNSRLQNAWNKYGEQAFTFNVIEKVPDVSQLLVREQNWMDITKPFYNIRLLAHSNLGLKASVETKQKQSLTRKGRKLSVEQKIKISKALKGNKYASGNRGKKLSLEHRKKISNTLLGTRHSPESYARQSAKLKGRKLSDETRAKLCLAQRARRNKEKIEVTV